MENTLVIYLDDKIMLMNKNVLLKRYTKSKFRDTMTVAIKIAIAYDLYKFGREA